MILVDAAAIAIPNYATTSDEAEKLILRLKHFAQTCSAGAQISFLVSDNIEYHLGFSAAYDDLIKDFLDQSGLNGIYDSKEMLRNISTLQHRSIRVSDWKYSFEVAAQDVVLDPAIPVGCSPADLVEVTKENLLFVSIARELGHILVLTSPFADPEALNYAVKANDLIVCDENGCIKEMAEHDGKALAISRLQCLLSVDFAFDLWLTSKNAEDLSVAISIGALALMSTSGTFPSKMPEPFSVGSDFYSSLAGNQAIGDGKFSRTVAQTCFQIVAGQFSGTDRIFGLHNAEIRKRDNAEGRRCHVTKGNEGLRMMYWKTADKKEFANIGPKNEKLICHGVADDTCCNLVSKVYLRFAE